ncbi:hypothetical protein Q7P37_001052 [Cladosporium fusiforme]
MPSFAWTRRHRRAAITAFTLLVLLAFWTVLRDGTTKVHPLFVDDATLPQSDRSNAHEDVSSPSLPPVDSICRTSGFPSYTIATRTRKVYDLVLLSTELDWLEIRLHTLAPHVDFFVVVESPTTFQGRPKPLWLQDNWARFAAFHDKIIHRVVEDGSPSRYIWDHETWLRNSMLNEVFPGLVGTRFEAEENDVLVVSDVDEIVRPEAMVLLRHCDFPARLTLQSDFYYYSFQWRHRGPQWAHPEATVYKGVSTLPPNTLRQGLLDDGWAPFALWRRWRGRATLLNAGWHCSSCFATVAEMRTKLHSFSHQNWDTEENRNAQVMMARVREGKDLFGRDEEVYEKVQRADMDLPRYIVEQNAAEGRFKFLIDRDGEDAGFEDWETASQQDG